MVPQKCEKYENGADVLAAGQKMTHEQDGSLGWIVCETFKGNQKPANRTNSGTITNGLEGGGQTIL